MIARLRFTTIVLASALGLLPMLGCMGTSNDKGDDPGAGKKTNPDASKTGGVGEHRGADYPRPGEAAPKGEN